MVVTNATAKWRVQLPPLHPGQALVEASPARFKVVVCGRRWGKTTYGVRTCIKYAMLTGQLYFWVGPSYKVANTGWKMLKSFARAIPGAEIREADKSVVLPNGGQVDVRSAVDPDSLRGEKLGGAVFDEFAQVAEATWTEVVLPSLIDLGGWALFIGTPKGNNWAKTLFDEAKLKSNWAAFHMPTSSNPFLSPAGLELIRGEYLGREQQMRQELEADFGASQYAVYETSPHVHRWSGDVPVFVRYHGGMDFAGDTVGAHKSATVIAGVTADDEMVLIAAFKQSGPNISERQLNWTLQQEQTLAEVHKSAGLKPPVISYRADKSQSVGIQFMRMMGLHVFPTKGGADSVEEGVQMVSRRLAVRADGRPRLWWLPGLYDVEKDFGNYRYPEPKNDGSVEKRNPLKVDDDLMDAVRYMVEGADREIIGNPHELFSNLIPRLAG